MQRMQSRRPHQQLLSRPLLRQGAAAPEAVAAVSGVTLKRKNTNRRLSIALLSSDALQELNPNVPLPTSPPQRRTRRSARSPTHLPHDAVRVQTALLQHDEENLSPSIGEWTSLRLIKQFVDPISKEKRATIAFDNGEETEVCWGALLFPLGNGRPRTKKQDGTEEIPEASPSASTPAEAGMGAANSLSRESSFDGDFDIFAMDDSSTESDSAKSSEEDVNILQVLTADEAEEEDLLVPLSTWHDENTFPSVESLTKVCSSEPSTCTTSTVTFALST